MFLIPNIGTIIWVTLIFSILLFILSKFAWKPLLRALKQREESIKDALSSAEEAKLKLISLTADKQKIISLAKNEKEKILKESNEQHDKIIAAAKEKAQNEAEKIIQDARKRIVFEREAALVEMKSQIAKLSLDIATKVVQADMEDKKRHEKLVAQLIDEVELN